MSSVNGAITWSTIPNSREITVVEIRNPFTHQKNNGKRYTDFEICLKSNSKAFTLPRSTVRRRYSDFVWLRDWLRENNEGFSSIRKTPSLPPKKLIGRFEDEFIEERMKGLQRFLRKVIEHNVFLSDKALHLFLQSNMNVKQIENYLLGKPVDLDIDYHSDHEMNTENKNEIESKNVAEASDSKSVNGGGIAARQTASLQSINEDGMSLSSDDTNKEHQEEKYQDEEEQTKYVYESFAEKALSRNDSLTQNQEISSRMLANTNEVSSERLCDVLVECNTSDDQNNDAESQNDEMENVNDNMDKNKEEAINNGNGTPVDDLKLLSDDSDKSNCSLDGLFDEIDSLECSQDESSEPIFNS